MAGVVDLPAERTGNPVVIADELYNIVASSPAVEHGDADRREASVAGERPQGSWTIRSLVPSTVALRMNADLALHPFPGHGMTMRRSMAPILDGPAVLGFVTLLESSRELRDHDTLVLQRAGLILAVELLHQRRVLGLGRARPSTTSDLSAYCDRGARIDGLRAGVTQLAECLLPKRTVPSPLPSKPSPPPNVWLPVLRVMRAT